MAAKDGRLVVVWLHDGSNGLVGMVACVGMVMGLRGGGDMPPTLHPRLGFCPPSPSPSPSRVPIPHGDSDPHGYPRVSIRKTQKKEKKR